MNSLLASHQMATDNASWAGRRFNGPPVGYLLVREKTDMEINTYPHT